MSDSSREAEHVRRIESVEANIRALNRLLANLRARRAEARARWDLAFPSKPAAEPAESLVAAETRESLEQMVHEFVQLNSGVPFSVARFAQLHDLRVRSHPGLRRALKAVAARDPLLRLIDADLYEYDGDPARVGLRGVDRGEALNTLRAWFRDHPLVEIGIDDVMRICDIRPEYRRRAGNLLRSLAFRGVAVHLGGGRYRAKR